MLVQHVSHSDADAAAAALESYWPGIILGAADGPVLFRMDGFTNDHGLAYVEVVLQGRQVSADVEATAGLMVTSVSSFDGVLMESGATIDDRQPYVTRAGLRSRYGSARTRTLAIDETIVDTYLRGRADGGLRGGFRFTGTAPVSERHGAAWRSLTSQVASAMHDGLADHPMLGPTLTNMVAAYCVACFPNNASAGAPDRSLSTATVRRAKAFIDEHATEPITVADIAEAARLSIRGLHSAFKSQVGVSPMEYRRRVRLSIARAALLAADPADDARVATIAHAAGFLHLGRFAAAYRALHGENPNDTLRSGC
jgi:AraC-like DNA-binding protein